MFLLPFLGPQLSEEEAERMMSDVSTYIMSCPHCKRTLKFGEKAIGKTKDCPNCKKSGRRNARMHVATIGRTTCDL